MTITTKLFTLFYGTQVGQDQFGNRYFTEKKAKGSRAKRWVVYNGKAEPSKVPAEWHGWLHHTQANPPSKRTPYAWELQSIPNLTGTKNAYLPSGHLEKGGNRAPSTADYEPWQP